MSESEAKNEMSIEEEESEKKCPKCGGKLRKIDFFSFKTPIGAYIVKLNYTYYVCKSCGTVFYEDVFGRMKELMRGVDTTILMMDAMTSFFTDIMGKKIRGKKL